MSLDVECLAYLAGGGVLGFFSGRYWADLMVVPAWFPRWLVTALNVWRHRG